MHCELLTPANVSWNWVLTTQSSRTQNKHNHPAAWKSSFVRQNVSNTLKRKVVDDLLVKCSKIILRELLANNCGNIISASDVKRFTRNMTEARLRVRPKLPTMVCELHAALNVYDRMMTNHSELFLLVNDATQNIIFSTETNLRFLVTCSCLYVDGTFESFWERAEAVYIVVHTSWLSLFELRSTGLLLTNQ